MLSTYHHGGCETVHAEREAWRNMRRKRFNANRFCSSKEQYFIVSVRLRDFKIVNGGKFCNICHNFLQRSQINYGVEFVDGEYRRVNFS